MTTQIKALVATGAALLLALAACAVLFLLWDAEKTAHWVTQRDYARDMAMAADNEKAAEDALEGLRLELRKAAAAFREYKDQERERQAIMAGAQPRQRAPEERERIVDDATRQKTADFLNAW